MTERRFERLSKVTAQAYDAPTYHGTYLGISLLNTTPTWTCALASRLSHESWDRSGVEADRQLLERLMERGDEHAKSLRMKLYTLAIEAPRYWWVEADTYMVGVVPGGSTSTMYKEARRLSGVDLVKVKSELSEGTLQLRIRMFSYPTLMRMISQRAHHRLPEWQEFCQFVDSYCTL